MARKNTTPRTPRLTLEEQALARQEADRATLQQNVDAFKVALADHETLPELRALAAQYLPVFLGLVAKIDEELPDFRLRAQAARERAEKVAAR